MHRGSSGQLHVKLEGTFHLDQPSNPLYKQIQHFRESLNNCHQPALQSRTQVLDLQLELSHVWHNLE